MASIDEGGGTSSIRTRSVMDVDDPEEGTSRIRSLETSVRNYGNIAGEEIGKTYNTRRELKVIHNPVTYWIHLGPEGPYSLIVQGDKRFLDEGTFIVLCTKETKQAIDKKGSIVDNLMKAVKAHLPIRVIRVVREDPISPPVYRYDGLYTMKKKLIIHGRLHFLLRRNKNQPVLKFKSKQTTSQIRHMLSLMKKFSHRKNKKAVHIKTELDLKKEIAYEHERDFSRRSIESFSWQQFKEEIVTLAEEETYEYNESWSEGRTPIIKGDTFNISDEDSESTVINYHSVEKFQMFYNNEETVELEEEVDHQNYFNDDVIIESIPVVKCENGENSHDVRTILAIIPESGTSEFVKELNTDIDPLHLSSDPLSNGSDDNKSSSSDSDEMKNSCEEKKSAEIFSSKSENKKGSEKEHHPTSYPPDPNIYRSHRCFYGLTLGQMVNALRGMPDSECPCSLPPYYGQQLIDNALRNLIDNKEKQKLKCIKGGNNDHVKSFETMGAREYDTVGNFLEQLAMLLHDNRSSELPSPVLVKTKQVTTNRIVKKGKKGTRKLHVKKYLSVEESLESNEDDPDLDSSFISPSPFRENEFSPSMHLQRFSQESEQLILSDEEPVQPPRRGRRKGKSLATISLGPVIVPNFDNSPRSKRGRILTYSRISSQFSRPRRSIPQLHDTDYENEEEHGFLGFRGPFRPSSKLRSIKSYLKRLLKS